MNWINYYEMPPPETGWYKVKSGRDEFEACYAGTLGGCRKWVVPDTIKITHWMPKEQNVQVSDTTEADQGGDAGKQKN